MLRLQDVLFGLVGIAVATLLALHLRVAVFALVGAFACGSVYVFAGMLPPPHESFLNRLFSSVFLAVVVSSLVMILPGTFGLAGSGAERVVMTIACLPPLVAACFEVLRTPQVIQAILRAFGQR